MGAYRRSLLADALVPADFRPGAKILEQGEPASARFHIIVSGKDQQEVASWVHIYYYYYYYYYYYQDQLTKATA